MLVGLTAVVVAGLSTATAWREQAWRPKEGAGGVGDGGEGASAAVAFAVVVLTLVLSVSVWLAVGPVRGDDPAVVDEEDLTVRSEDGDEAGAEDGGGEEEEVEEVEDELEAPLLASYEGEEEEEEEEEMEGDLGEDGSVEEMRRGRVGPSSSLLEFAVADVATPAAVGEGGVTLFQAVGTPEFWLAWMVLVVAAGSGVTVINEAGAMAAALGAGPGGAGACVTLLSASNCLGRVLMGEAIDGLKPYGVHLPTLLGLASALMACAATALSIGTLPSMYGGCALAGLAYGAFFSLIPNLARDLFGLAHVGALYGAFGATNAFGSYIFNVLVAGPVYADAERREGLVDGRDECLGATCFRITFVVMAASCMGGACVSALLALRTMPFYRQRSRKRRRRSLG